MFLFPACTYTQVYIIMQHIFHTQFYHNHDPGIKLVVWYAAIHSYAHVRYNHHWNTHCTRPI